MAYAPKIFRHEDDGSTTRMTMATVESLRNLMAELAALRRDNAVLKRALEKMADDYVDDMSTNQGYWKPETPEEVVSKYLAQATAEIDKEAADV